MYSQSFSGESKKRRGTEETREEGRKENSLMKFCRLILTRSLYKAFRSNSRCQFNSFMQSHFEIYPRRQQKNPIVAVSLSLYRQLETRERECVCQTSTGASSQRDKRQASERERAHEGNEECTYFRAHSFSSSSLSTYMIYCSIGRARARFSLPIVVFMATHSTSITSNLCGKFFSNSGGSSSSTFSLVCT